MERIDITLTLNLPQELVDEAKSAGLLTEEQIERGLTDELDRRRKRDRFFSKLDRLAAVEPPLTRMRSTPKLSNIVVKSASTR